MTPGGPFQPPPSLTFWRLRVPLSPHCIALSPADLWPLLLDRAADAVSEQPSTMGCHPAGMHPGVHCHRVCEQPSHHHHLPAHRVQSGE